MNFSRLGDITNLYKGKKPTQLVETALTGYKPYILIESLDGTPKKWTNDTKGILASNGDILIVWDGARAGLIGKSIEGYVGSTIAKVETNPDLIITDYLYYYLYSKYQSLNKNTRGTGIPHLDKNYFNSLEILVPTLSEQKQIVSKIKECLTLLDKSEEKLKQAQKKLSSVMDSVYYKEIPTPKNLNGSTITKLDDLAEKITDGSHNPPMKQKNGKLMLSAINIENDFLNIEANVRYIKEEDFNKELNRSGVKKGDVLLTAVGTIGRTLVVKEFTDFVLQRSVTLIRPKDTEISQYLSYYLRTPYMQRYFLENAKGTAQKGIYLSTIRKLEVVIPERSKMRTIIEKIDNVRNATTNSLKHIESLQKNLQIERQSILKKAFEGKLI